MTERVGVVVATYGDRDEWWELAERAVASARSQSVAPAAVVWQHERTLSDARNLGAYRAGDVDWLVFLDADDTLDGGYIEAMLLGTGKVRQPSTLGVYDDGSTDSEAVLIPPKKNLLDGNHLVIGSMVSRDLFVSAGGFDELPILEDWDLWIRCWLLGAEIGTAPGAIYRVSVNRTGRNSAPNHGDVYTRIRQKYTAMARDRGLV